MRQVSVVVVVDVDVDVVDCADARPEVASAPTTAAIRGR
jgi:hypothetical protein